MSIDLKRSIRSCLAYNVMLGGERDCPNRDRYIDLKTNVWGSGPMGGAKPVCHIGQMLDLCLRARERCGRTLPVGDGQTILIVPCDRGAVLVPRKLLTTFNLGDDMRRLIILILVLPFFSCVQGTEVQIEEYPDFQAFTLPFDRSLELTVWEVGDWSVWFGLAVPELVLAPNDVEVLDVRVGTVVLKHFELNTLMILDDIDEMFVEPGDQVCAGDVIGKTKQMRLRATYALGELANLNQHDLGLVRVVRNNVVTDLSEVRPMDSIHSALGLSPEWPRVTDINEFPCVYDTEEE